MFFLYTSCLNNPKYTCVKNKQKGSILQAFLFVLTNTKINLGLFESMPDFGKRGGSERKEPADLSALMKEHFAEELASDDTKAPLFKICPDCGKHGGILFYKDAAGDYAMSNHVMSQKQAMMCLEHYQKTETPLSDDVVAQLTKDIEGSLLPRTFPGLRGFISGDDKYAPEVFKK